MASSPSQLGPFEIIGELPGAETGWLGRRRDGDEEVFVLRPLEPGESLKRTASFLPQLRHSGLCVVVHTEPGGTRPFYAREHVAGKSLVEVLSRLQKKKESLAPGLVHHLVRELLLALDFLHRQTDPLTRAPMNLSHGEVSERAMLIGYDGEVKLKDFGLKAGRPEDDLRHAARLARRLFGRQTPGPVSTALSDEGAFESCRALAEALNSVYGQGERAGKKAVRELMARLFPDEAAQERERLHTLLRRAREQREDIPEVKAPPRAPPPSAPRHAQREEKKEAPPHDDGRRARLLTILAFVGLGAIFISWAVYMVVLLFDSGLSGEVTPTGFFDDNGSGGGGRIIRSPPPRSNLSRAGVEHGKVGGGPEGKAKQLTSADKTIVDGCNHPCAAAVLKAMVPGGSVEQEDKGREVLTRANIDVCINLCRNQGGR